MCLTLFGGWGMALCLLCVFLEAHPEPPLLLRLEFGSMPLRRPPSLGLADVLRVGLGLLAVAALHLRISRQTRQAWQRMEEVRLALEEIDRKMKEVQASCQDRQEDMTTHER